MHILLARHRPRAFITAARSFFKAKEYVPESSSNRRSKYPVKEQVKADGETKQVSLNEELSALPYYTANHRPIGAVTKYVFEEWRQDKKNTAFLPVYRNLGILFVTLFFIIRIGIKETRNEGGYLYETDLSIAFCGTFEQRENIALNKIRRIVDQIKRLAKEEQRSKFEADQKRALSNEIQCYYFPSYSNVEQNNLKKMPFLKSGMRRKEPLWRQRDRAAQKEGLRSTVYYVNGDHYCGEWSDNLRHGLGVMTYKKDKTQYTGDWAQDQKAGEGILSQLINGVYKGIYSGQWLNDERNGAGVNFYPNPAAKEGESEVYYDGNWLDDKRHGQGKMFYGDKSVYDGEWEADLEMGYGRLYMPNGDMYQGHWKDGKRHGEGEYHFQSRGQVMKGTWSNGICKCAELSASPDQAAASTPFKYPIPQIELVDPEHVLSIARAKYAQ